MNYSRKSYRYILTGTADIDSPICNYKMVSQNHFPTNQEYPISQAIRFLVPKDMSIQQNRGLSYSTTTDTRTLKEIEAKIVVKINGRWKESPFGLTLENTQPYRIMPIMMQHDYFITPFGYLDKDRYTFFVNHYALTETSNTSYTQFDKEYKLYAKQNPKE